MSDEARYLYCIARGHEELQLGDIGIEEKLVYTVPHTGHSGNCTLLFACALRHHEQCPGGRLGA